MWLLACCAAMVAALLLDADVPSYVALRAGAAMTTRRSVVAVRGLRAGSGAPQSAHRGASSYWLDTADAREWDANLGLGIWSGGITTNPLLCQRAGVACTRERLSELVRSALERVPSVMVQSWGREPDAMVANGMALAGVDAERVVVKVPITRSGVEAASRLRAEGVRICMTACYAPHQVFTSVGVDAEFVAPYLGRMCDAGMDGIAEVTKMQRIVEGLGASTRVFVASLRSADQLAALAAAGCSTFTFSPKIAAELFAEPLTEDAAAMFEDMALQSLQKEH